MKKTRFRKGGMAVCMFLAVTSGMPVAVFPTLSYAQTQTTTPGSSVATGLASGQSPAQIAASLAGQGGANVQQWTTILNSLQSGGATTAAITSVVNILAGGTMNPTQAASAIAAALPSLAAALGGASGILGALSSAGGLAAGLAGAISSGTGTGTGGTGTGGSGPGSQGNGGNGGGQQVMSQQNPVNNSHTDAGCNCQSCNTHIPNHYSAVRSHTQAEFQRHRSWIVNTFWLENMLPALQRMAAQLTAVGIAQIQMIGAMLDAKHQLETQRIFQQMMAQAHKDYQPSEGMCTFGTTVRSLAGSERRSNLAQMAFSQRMNQRQTLSGDVISREGLDSDKRSRLQHFIANYCDQADNANGLNRLCRTAVTTPARRNIDVDYTRNIESRLTLDVSFLPAPTPAGLSPTERDEFNTAQAAAPATNDEQDVFALSANLFANQIASAAAPENLAIPDGRIRLSNVEKYMDLRSIFAKRSVAQNSFAAIVAQRAAGAPESAPYTKAVLRELGITSDTEINQLLGENPSYFAQMEVLTKKLYQNPSFYTELYDKPVNVERKAAAMQAIGLMQDRDLYNSLLRSEVVLSVLLETMLQKEQDKVANEGPKRNPAAGAR